MPVIRQTTGEPQEIERHGNESWVTTSRDGSALLRAGEHTLTLAYEPGDLVVGGLLRGPHYGPLDRHLRIQGCRLADIEYREDLGGNRVVVVLIGERASGDLLPWLPPE